MALTKYTLGDLLDRNNETNIDLKYSIDDVRGVLNTKGILTFSECHHVLYNII